MSDRQLHPDLTDAISEAERNLSPASLPSPSVSFRMTADLVVEIKTAAKFLQQPDLSSEERRFFLTILTTPDALNRVCRLAVVDDLAREEDGLFEGQFFGPQSEDILAVVMPYLSKEDQLFWTRLQQENSAADFLTEMFCEFKTALRRVDVEERSSGEAIPLQTRRCRLL